MVRSDPLLHYLAGYPPDLLASAASLLQQGIVLDTLSRRYGPPHELRTDGALYGYVMQIRGRYLRSADPLSRVAYDNRLHVVRNALGMHTTVSRVQGGRLAGLVASPQSRGDAWGRQRERCRGARRGARRG